MRLGFLLGQCLAISVAMSCHCAIAGDVLLSCLGPVNLPSPINNGTISLGSSLLIASMENVTLFDGVVDKDARSIGWPDKIIGAVKRGDTAIIVSNSSVSEVDEKGLVKQLFSLDELRSRSEIKDAEEDQAFLSDVSVELYKNDTLIVQSEDGTYILRIPDGRALYLGRTNVLPFFPAAQHLDETGAGFLGFSREDGSHILDLSNVTVIDLDPGVPIPKNISQVGNKIAFQYTDTIGSIIAVYDPNTRSTVSAREAVPLNQPFFFMIDDDRVGFTEGSSPFNQFYVLSLKDRTIQVGTGNNGALGATDNGTFWYTSFASQILVWDPSRESLQPVGGLPSEKIRAVLPIDHARVIVAADAGLFLADLKSARASVLTTATQIAVMQRANDGLYIFASPTQLVTWNSTTGDVSTEKHDAGRISSLVVRDDVVYAVGAKGIARLNYKLKRISFVGADDNWDHTQLRINVADKYAFVMSALGNASFIFSDGYSTKKLALPHSFFAQKSGRLADGRYFAEDGNDLYLLDMNKLEIDHLQDRSLVSNEVYSIGSSIYAVPPNGEIKKAYFRVPLRDVFIANKTKIERISPEGVSVALQWKFRHPCEKGLSTFRPTLRISGGPDHEDVDSPLKLSTSRTEKMGWVTATSNADFNVAGSWDVKLLATVDGVKTVLAADKLVIGFSWWNFIVAQWKLAAAVAAALYVASFVALFALSHYKSWAMGILTDPVWAKVAVWPFFALRHWQFAQRWVLEPYFKAVMEQTASDAPKYLSVPAENGAGQTKDATTLLRQLVDRRKVWLHGGPGMGKSLIFRMWLREYFLEYKNLKEAQKAFGFILIPVLVRNYADLPEKPEQRSEWLVEVIRRELVSHRIRIQDPALLRSMISSGRFAIALDGLNEADRDGAVSEFLASYPAAKVIVTCQSRSLEGFDLWSLPKNVSHLVGGLLTLWMGDIEGVRLHQELSAQNVLEHLVSGYDVRLVYDLAKRPGATAVSIKSRVDLYRAALSMAACESGEPLDHAMLMKTAWRMLIEGRRHLTEDECKDIAEIEQLTAEDVRILRRMGRRYEFRHDQMRSFLASLQLIEESPSIAVVIERLDDNPVWSCTRRDQEEFWRFVAELLNPVDLNALWQAMLTDPERAWAQSALLYRARRDGIALEVVTLNVATGLESV